MRDDCHKQPVALILRRVRYAAACPPAGGLAAPMGGSRAHHASDQGTILTRLRRHTPLHGKPSKLTIAATGSTVLAAAAASGVVALWPTAPAAQRPAGSVAARRASATSLRLDSDGVDSQVQVLNAALAQKQKAASLVAQEIAARKGAAERAARKAAERRAAATAAAQRQAAQPQASPPRPSQAAPAPEPSGSPQQIAMGMLGSYGWPSSQFSCLDSLWKEESGWNVDASNPGSGAYGIPQALPGSKMASAGPDWQTDAATQIRWGLGYIKADYGSPCGAWAHEEADGWY